MIVYRLGFSKNHPLFEKQSELEDYARKARHGGFNDLPRRDKNTEEL
jgi:hypothetical protein